MPVRPLTVTGLSTVALSPMFTFVVFSKTPGVVGVEVTAFTVAAASTRPVPQPPVQVPASGRVLSLIADSTCAGVSEGLAATRSAARPATCGAAMLVPW